MEHLLRQPEKFRSLRKVMLLLDYDGTITPIVKRPELAILHPGTRELLKALAKRFKVAIISGRSIADIRKLVGLDSLYYAGNHGFEITGRGVKIVKHEAERARPVIAEMCRELREKTRGIGGVVVEDKGLTASIHYRLVKKEKVGKFKKTFETLVKPYLDSGGIRVTRGKKVFEIRPNIGWGKGKAVLWIMDTVDPKKKLVPVYIGDDRTDEDAFLALENRGMTVLVSEKPKRSHAKFFLRNVGEVEIFLKRLAENTN